MVAAWCLDRYAGVVGDDANEDFRVAPNETDEISWNADRSQDGERRAWSLIFRHVDHDDPSLRWRVLAQLSLTEGRVRFTVRISQESIGGPLRPAIDVPGRPRVVRDIARELGGTSDGRPVTGAPSEVRSDDVAQLAALLTDPTRRLPVVAISPAADTGRPLTDPVYLADQLTGLAHVFEFMAAPATYELTVRVGRSLSVFDGAVRIYWPGLGDDSDPYLHRLWLPGTVEAIDRRRRERDRPVGFARHLVGLVGDVAALRIGPDPVARALRREAEARQLAAERAEWARLADQAAIPDIFAEEFDRQTARIAELELALEIADEERTGLETEVARLSRSFGDVRAAIARERGDEGPDPGPIASIAEALRLVALNHPEAVVVLDDAHQSAAETRYRQIDRAAAALRAVGEVAQGWHDGTPGTGFDNAFSERGFELRSVSSVTQGRHASDYARTFAGERVMLGPHIALGDGGSTDTIFRAYWYLDEQNRRFVLGHVGLHLEDSST